MIKYEFEAQSGVTLNVSSECQVQTVPELREELK